MAKKTAPTPPPDALPAGESNPYLKKFKTSLSKRWSLTRMETLLEIADLALFLWALDRDKEALAVATAIATSIPSPPPLPRGGFNYNIWYPAVFSHALVVRLGGGKPAKVSRDAILSDSGISRTNPDALTGEVAQARELAASTMGQDTIKWECRSLARELGSMVIFSELAKAGDALFKPHAKAVEPLIPKLRSMLGARLQDKK